jgi:hypothetical protein
LFIQPPNGIINLGDTTYHVLDEILAPIVGAYPYGDYTPQYSAMLGWLIIPLKILPFSGSTKMVLIIVFCNLLTMIVPVFVTMILKSLFQKTAFLTILTAFIAVWAVSGPGLGMTVQLREFSHFARFSPALLLLLLASQMLNNPTDSIHRSKTLLTGFVMSFAILNSPDVGLGLAVALTISLLIAQRSRFFKLERLMLLLASASACIVGYFILLVALGKNPSILSIIGLRRDASNLYPDYALDVFGPHIIIIGLAISAIAAGIRISEENILSSREISQRVMVLTVGIWTLFLLPKFLLFPHPVGIPGLFIPAFLSGAILVKIYSPLISDVRSKVNGLKALPILCLACLPIGALWQHSNPADEYRRITRDSSALNDWSSQPGRVADSWTFEGIQKYDDLIVEVQRARVQYQSTTNTFGYFGLFGNTVELLTGVNNYFGIPAPESLRFGTTQETLACKPVSRYKPDILLVYGSGFPCEGYEVINETQGGKFKVYNRK